MEKPERTRRNKKKNKKRGGKLAEAKVVMVGDASVGKTSLLHRYMEREYIECSSTIGVAFSIKTWGIHDIAIWDTAGEEKYAGMTTFYYRNAAAAIVTFDMFDRTSFYNLSSRYIPILNDVAKARSNVLKVIVANKTDLLDTYQRRVSREEGLELARVCNPGMDDTNLPYFETSAKTGENVDEVFEYVFRFFYPNPDEPSQSASDKLEGSIKLDDTPKMRSNFHCCH